MATAVLLSAYSLALAVLGPTQTLHFQVCSLQPLPSPPATTLLAHVLGSWKDCTWPLHSLVSPQQGLSLSTAISQGMAHGVCDGSYMQSSSLDLATAAWLLEDSRFPTTTSAMASLMCQALHLMSMPTLNHKASMPSFLPFRLHAPFIPLHPVQFLSDVTT